MSKHHYAVELARRGYKVFFANPPGAGRRFNILPDQRYPGIYEIDGPAVARGLRFYPGFLRRWLERRWLERVEAQAKSKVTCVWLFENSRFFDLAFAGDRLKIYHQVDLNQDFNPGVAATTADICFATTDAIVKNLLRFNRRVYKIHHGVYIPAATPSLTEKDAVNFRGKAVHVAYIGNLDIPYLDVPLLSQLVTKYPDVTFHFVGMYRDDGELRRACSSAENVIWWGQVDSERIPAILQRCDVLLVTYLSEQYRDQLASPHKMMEYLASGKTIVATYTDEYRDKSELLEMVNKNSDYERAFRHVVTHLEHFNSQEKRQSRMEFARRHRYEMQLNTIIELLTKHHLSING